MLDFIELFILGIGVGSFGALVGIGGGLIMVPLFMYFMMPPSGSTFANVQEVVGTSLFGVLLNALSGTWAYFRQKRIILSVAMPFALATVPGAFLGSYVSEWFSGPAFSITFGASLAFLGCFMYWSSRNKAANRSADEFDPNELPRSKIWLGIGCSFFVGFISSILGIGGGARSDDGLPARLPAARRRGHLYLRAHGERRHRRRRPCATRPHRLGPRRRSGLRRHRGRTARRTPCSKEQAPPHRHPALLRDGRPRLPACLARIFALIRDRLLPSRMSFPRPAQRRARPFRGCAFFAVLQSSGLLV